MTSSRNSHWAALSFFQALKTRRSSCLTVTSDAPKRVRENLLVTSSDEKHHR